MECIIIGCKRLAKHTYTMGKVIKFSYCDKHENIPKKQIETINKGYCRRFQVKWGDRELRRRTTFGLVVVVLRSIFVLGVGMGILVCLKQDKGIKCILDNLKLYK